jgi:beta-galactosidase
LMNRSKPMILDALPATVRPIVQPIDDWNTCRRLGLVVEAKVGPGKLIIAACDLETDMAQRPVARQLRASLLAYMNSPEFQPAATLSADDLDKVLGDGLANHTVTGARASTEAPGHPAAHLIDGDPETFWHSAWEGKAAAFPHDIIIDLAKTAKVSGLRLLPRQGDNRNGWVKDIEILTSTDGKEWKMIHQSALAKNHEWKALTFAPAAARQIKIRALSPHDPTQPFASFAELDPVIEP